MTRDEYNILFHKIGLNRVAFKAVNDCDEEILALVNEAIAAEREACAKLLAEEVARQVSNDTNGKAAVLHCAFAIRERGAP